MSVRAAAGVLGAATAGALWVSAGSAGLLYAVVFAVAVLPGMPLGIALFGRKNPAGWVAGALVGYGLTQLALWAGIAAPVPARAGFVLIWILVLAGAAWLGRQGAGRPVISDVPWTVQDVRVFLLVLLLVPVLMGLTYRNLGRQDATGNRYYRAYFTADFLWHSALAYELGKLSLPPRNPYLAPRPMNYYWTYFLLPATAAALAEPRDQERPRVEAFLKANAILAGMLMIGALFLVVRAGTPDARHAAAAVVLAVAAASAEGLYAVVDLLIRGRPLEALFDTNIDAVTAWSFGGLRIDNIPRSLWYTPQHTTSLALGLIGVLIAVLTGAAARPAAILAAGLALGLSTTMNPLLGAAASAIYGICVTADGIARPGGLLMIARHGLAALFVAAAVGWGAASRVMDGAGSALDVGFSGFSRQRPVLTLLLSLGPVLLPALAGAMRPGHGTARRSVVAACAGLAVGLFLLYFVRISEASWVGFRAGQILLVSIPVLLARTIHGLPVAARRALIGLILVAGIPTTAIDTYNAQDIWNRRPGPGFRWTLWTTPSQEEAFAWIRANTEDHDIVQMEPVLRAREHWTLIPSFAGRRMAAGQPISLLPLPEYRERSEQVRTMFATSNVAEALSIAHRLRIDYLYVESEDRAAYPEGTAKFDNHPESFERVFANRDVQVYRVR